MFTSKTYIKGFFWKYSWWTYSNIPIHVHEHSSGGGGLRGSCSHGGRLVSGRCLGSLKFWLCDTGVPFCMFGSCSECFRNPPHVQPPPIHRPLSSDIDIYTYVYIYIYIYVYIYNNNNNNKLYLCMYNPDVPRISRRFNARKHGVRPLRASQSLSETSPCSECKAFVLQRRALRGNRASRIGSWAHSLHRLQNGGMLVLGGELMEHSRAEEDPSSGGLWIP